MGAELDPVPRASLEPVQGQEILGQEVAEWPDFKDDMPEIFYLLCDASAKAYALQTELEEQDPVPESQAAREALEVSIELILQKSRIEYERRQRAYAELLEDEQAAEAERLAQEQARAADLAELHKKEVALKRVRAVSTKEKRRLLEDRKGLEEEYKAELQLKNKQDAEIEAKINAQYDALKAEDDKKFEDWTKLQEAKIRQLTQELKTQVELAQADLEKEITDHAKQDEELRKEEDAADRELETHQAIYNRLLEEMESSAHNLDEAKRHRDLVQEDLLTELDQDRRSHEAANDEYAARSKQLDIDEKEFLAEHEEEEKATVRDFHSAMEELEAATAATETQILDVQKEREAETERLKEQLERRKLTTAEKRAQLERDAAAMQEERRKLPSRAAEQESLELGDMQRMAKEETDSSRKAEDVKGELEAQVLAMHARAEQQRVADLETLEEKRKDLQARMASRAELIVAQETAVEDERQAAKEAEERLREIQIASDLQMQEMAQAIDDAQQELEGGKEAQEAARREGMEKFHAAKSRVDEATMELARAKEQHELEGQRLELVAEAHRAKMQERQEARARSREAALARIEEEAKQRQLAAHEWAIAEKERIVRETAELAIETTKLEHVDVTSQVELDNAMAMAVDVDESLRVEEKHLKAEQFRKEELLREEGKKLSAEEAKVRTSFAAKAEAVEESIQAQEAALEVEVEALQGLVSQRERAVQAVVDTVKRERAKQEKLLVRLQATAQKDMEHLVKMEPKWREEIEDLRKQCSLPETSKLKASELRMRIVALELKLAPVDTGTFARPIRALEARMAADAVGRQAEIEAEELFLASEARRVTELVQTRRHALEEVKKLERKRLEHEQRAFEQMMARRRNGLEDRMQRLKDDCAAQWQLMQHLRAQVDETIHFQQKEELGKQTDKRDQEKRIAKWGRQLEIAERDLPANLEKKLQESTDEVNRARAALGDQDKADAEQAAAEQAEYDGVVGGHNETRHMHDLEQLKLAEAVQEASRAVVVLQKEISDERERWEQVTLPGLEASLREKQQARETALQEVERRQKELAEEIKIRYEQIEVSRSELVTSKATREAADWEDKQSHANVEEEYKNMHENRLVQLTEDEVKMREKCAEDIKRIENELFAFKELVAMDTAKRAAEAIAHKENLENKQKELDQIRLSLASDNTELQAEHARLEARGAALKTELEAMRAGSAADYHARKQVLTKKKVLAQEAVQARKVDRLTELRGAREAVLATLELAHTKHTQAQARCNHLKQRLAAAKQDLEEAEFVCSAKKQKLSEAETELEKHREEVEKKLPVVRRRFENVHTKEKARLEKELAELREEYEHEKGELEAEMATKQAKLQEELDVKLDAMRAELYAKIAGRREEVAADLSEREKQLQAELREIEEAEEKLRLEEEANIAEVDERTEKRRQVAREKAELRLAKHNAARKAHAREKEAFAIEMDMMQEQLDLDLEEFEAQELKFEAQIKARRIRELEEETQRMQELMESEKARMQEEMRTAQRLAKAKAEAEERARAKAQRRLEREQERLRARMEMEAAAERARIQAEMARMEAERLTLLAAHDSDESSSDDDELNSMHIDLTVAAKTVLGAQEFGRRGDASTQDRSQTDAKQDRGSAGGHPRPSPRVSGLRDQVAHAPASEQDLEALKARELQAFEEEKKRMMAEIARMEDEAKQLAKEYDAGEDYE